MSGNFSLPSLYEAQREVRRWYWLHRDAMVSLTSAVVMVSILVSVVWGAMAADAQQNQYLDKIAAQHHYANAEKAQCKVGSTENNSSYWTDCTIYNQIDNHTYTVTNKDPVTQVSTQNQLTVDNMKPIK